MSNDFMMRQNKMNKNIRICNNEDSVCVNRQSNLMTFITFFSLRNGN